MKTLQIAILAIFILFQARVKSQETLETVSESVVNGTFEDESIVQNSTETRPQQCKQNLKQYNAMVDSFVILVTNMQSQLTSLVTQNNQKDEEIRSLKNKINALEANQDTPKVIFSGVRRKRISSGSDLTFDEAVANFGQGFNPETGIFNCPVSGIYSLSFSALTDKSNHYTDVQVYKNDIYQYEIHEDSRGHESYVNLSHVWIMVLQKNDRVQLKLRNGKGLYGYSSYPIWFNGQLLIENQ